MIPFFRKIRKQFADDNKPLKYMRYAIGEIILVVVGILIALSINNWNEEKKEAEVEISYLERLLVDVKKDTATLNQKIQLADKLTANYINYIRKMYTELVNSGKLDLLSDNLLKNKIVVYYKGYKNVSSKENQLDETTRESIQILRQFTPMLKYLLRPTNIFSDDDYMYNDEDWQFINKPTSIEFRYWEEAIYSYLFKQATIKPIYADLNSKADELINSIEEVLKISDN